MRFNDDNLDEVDVEKTSNDCKEEENYPKKPCIAAHCVAGLGRYFYFLLTKRKRNPIWNYRAPVLIAIALIEEGMDPLESVAFIRKHRQGAISNKQLKYIENYKRRRRHEHVGCCISWMTE